MKKYIIALLAVLCLVPMTTYAKAKTTTTTTTKLPDDLVKVYVFQKDGCQYCELQLEYLEGLESLNKKFTIVKKELYKTTETEAWAHGEDYNLGVKVANAFNAAGFKDASYDGTPFVVISDLYAQTAYSSDLEAVIDEAYEKGDKDVVTCLDEGKENCLPEGPNQNVAGYIILGITGVIVIIIIIASIRNKKELDEIIDDEPVAEDALEKKEKKETSKTVAKKTAAKKTTSTRKKKETE